MTWVLYNAEEILLERNMSLVGIWSELGYVLHGCSEDESTVSRFVDEINHM